MAYIIMAIAHLPHNEWAAHNQPDSGDINERGGTGNNVQSARESLEMMRLLGPMTVHANYMLAGMFLLDGINVKRVRELLNDVEFDIKAMYAPNPIPEGTMEAINNNIIILKNLRRVRLHILTFYLLMQHFYFLF